MVGIKRFQSYANVAAVLTVFFLIVSCEPLAMRSLADKLAEGGAKHLYITDRDASRIYRCELDGSNLVEIGPLSNRGNPAMIAVDPVAGRLFWTSTPSGGFWEVLSADLDGSGIFVLFKEPSTTPARGPRGLSPKSSTGTLYWAGVYNSLLYEQEYSAAVATSLEPDPSVAFFYDIFYHPELDRIFVANQPEGRIHRIRTDGTHEATLQLDLVALDEIFNLTVDGVRSHVYFSCDDGNDITSGGAIKRCDTDLSESSVVVFIASAGSPRQLVVDPDEGWLFWADATAGGVKRANLDGTEITTIVSGLQNPRGVALDPVRR